MRPQALVGLVLVSESDEFAWIRGLVLVVAVFGSWAGYLYWHQRRALARWRQVADTLGLEIKVGRRRVGSRARSMDGMVEGVKVRVLWSRREAFSTMVSVGSESGSTNLRSATRITARLPSPVDPAGLDPESLEALQKLERVVGHLRVHVDLDSRALGLTLPGEEPTAKILRDTIVLLARTAGKLSSS